MKVTTKIFPKKTVITITTTTSAEIDELHYCTGFSRIGILDPLYNELQKLKEEL